MLRKEIKLHWWATAWKEDAAYLTRLPDLLAPTTELPDTPCVDAVAAVVKDPASERCIALMSYHPHSLSSSLGPLSAGKSSVVLRLLGVTLGRAIAQTAPCVTQSLRTLELVASDMGYWSATAGHLQFISIAAEIGWFAWDLARLLSRAEGKVTEETKARCFRRLPELWGSLSLSNLLTHSSAPYRITDVVAFDEADSLVPPAGARLIAVDHSRDRRAILHNTLCSALRQRSNYWRRPAEPHVEVAAQIVEELRELPAIWLLRRTGTMKSVAGSIQSRATQINRLFRPIRPVVEAPAASIDIHSKGSDR